MLKGIILSFLHFFNGGNSYNDIKNYIDLTWPSGLLVSVKDSSYRISSSHVDFINLKNKTAYFFAELNEFHAINDTTSILRYGSRNLSTSNELNLYFICNKNYAVYKNVINKLSNN